LNLFIREEGIGESSVIKKDFPFLIEKYGGKLIEEGIYMVKSKNVMVMFLSVLFLITLVSNAMADNNDLSGNWIEKNTGEKCVIKQNGNNLAFSNYGGSGKGQITSSSTIVTTGWGGGSGTITNNGNTIIWANDYTWNRK
jgi:hypothetical protein